MTSNNRVAEDLREHVVFKIVPFLNPDGVYLGNSRANLLGQDLNRHWHDADPWKHPTIHAIKKLLEALDTAADDEGDDEEGGGDVRRLCLEKVRGLKFYFFETKFLSKWNFMTEKFGSSFI